LFNKTGYSRSTRSPARGVTRTICPDLCRSVLGSATTTGVAATTVGKGLEQTHAQPGLCSQIVVPAFRRRDRSPRRLPISDDGDSRFRLREIAVRLFAPDRGKLYTKALTLLAWENNKLNAECFGLGAE